MSWRTGRGTFTGGAPLSDAVVFAQWHIAFGFPKQHVQRAIRPGEPGQDGQRERDDSELGGELTTVWGG